MAGWILYVRDYSADVVPVFSGFTNGANCTSGYDSMVASIAASGTKTITWTFASAVTCQAVGIANHTLTSADTVSLQYSGSYTHVGTSPDPATGAVDQVLDMGASQSSTIWRVSLVVTGSRKIGCVSLLSGGAKHLLTFENISAPRFPLGNQYGAMVAVQATGAGHWIEQRRGGAYEMLDMTFPYVPKSLASGAGYIDESFLNEVEGSQGWLGPLWVTDDKGKAYHVNIVRPVDAPVTHLGGLQTVTLRLRTVPHIGLV